MDVVRFGSLKKKDPKLHMREWLTKLRKEDHVLDREVLGLEKEDEKLKQSVKAAVKRNDKNLCVVLAKQLLMSQKTKLKINRAKMHVKLVESNLNNQLAAMRTSGAVEKSIEVTKSMSHLVKIGDLSKTMKEMSKEMKKVGLIDELMEAEVDVLDEELENEAQRQVEKILWELTGGQLGKLPPSVEALPVSDTVKSSRKSIKEQSTTKPQKQAQALTG